MLKIYQAPAEGRMYGEAPPLPVHPPSPRIARIHVKKLPKYTLYLYQMGKLINLQIKQTSHSVVDRLGVNKLRESHELPAIYTNCFFLFSIRIRQCSASPCPREAAELRQDKGIHTSLPSVRGEAVLPIYEFKTGKAVELLQTWIYWAT